MPHAACDERIAVDAVRASSAPHAFLSVSKQGVAGIVETTGNRDCHVVMPPGDAGVARAVKQLDALELPARVMLSCRSAADVHEVAAATSKGGRHVHGLLLPSFLVGGAQILRPGDPSRTYGMSVTEPCLDWTTTESLLDELAVAVRERRRKGAPAVAREPSEVNLQAFFEHGRLEATDNLRVRRIRPLMPAAICLEDLPMVSATCTCP